MDSPLLLVALVCLATLPFAQCAPKCIGQDGCKRGVQDDSPDKENSALFNLDLQDKIDYFQQTYDDYHPLDLMPRGRFGGLLFMDKCTLKRMRRTQIVPRRGRAPKVIKPDTGPVVREALPHFRVSCEIKSYDSRGEKQKKLMHVGTFMPTKPRAALVRGKRGKYFFEPRKAETNFALMWMEKFNEDENKCECPDHNAYAAKSHSFYYAFRLKDTKGNMVFGSNVLKIGYSSRCPEIRVAEEIKDRGFAEIEIQSVYLGISSVRKSDAQFCTLGGGAFKKATNLGDGCPMTQQNFLVSGNSELFNLDYNVLDEFKAFGTAKVNNKAAGAVDKFMERAENLRKKSCQTIDDEKEFLKCCDFVERS